MTARKKTVCALAALAALGAVSGTARAQSSITLYGVGDLGVRYVHNEGAGSVRSLSSGNNSTSRIGFRGLEDLGGGLYAAFNLEAGISADTGSSVSATQFFDRASHASIGSRTLGEVRLGRDYVPTYSNWVRFDPFSNVGAAGVGNLISATPAGPVRSAFGAGQNTLVRSNNSLQYLLPSNLGGLEGSVMVAAGEGGTAANGQHKLVAARLGYAAGPVVVSAATAWSENNLTAGERFKDDIVGASYDFGVVKLSGAWRRFRFAAARETHALVAAVVPVGGAGQVKLSYQRVRFAGNVGTLDLSPSGASQVGVGYVHNLSKLTALYATISRVGNRGTSTFAVPGGPAGLASGGTSTGAEAGLRVSF
jgi:predicted porin